MPLFARISKDDLYNTVDLRNTTIVASGPVDDFTNLYLTKKLNQIIIDNSIQLSDGVEEIILEIEDNDKFDLAHNYIKEATDMLDELLAEWLKELNKSNPDSFK